MVGVSARYQRLLRYSAPQPPHCMPSFNASRSAYTFVLRAIRCPFSPSRRVVVAIGHASFPDLVLLSWARPAASQRQPSAQGPSTAVGIELPLGIEILPATQNCPRRSAI